MYEWMWIYLSKILYYMNIMNKHKGKLKILEDGPGTIDSAFWALSVCLEILWHS